MYSAFFHLKMQIWKFWNNELYVARAPFCSFPTSYMLSVGIFEHCPIPAQSLMFYVSCTFTHLSWICLWERFLLSYNIAIRHFEGQAPWSSMLNRTSNILCWTSYTFFCEGDVLHCLFHNTRVPALDFLWTFGLHCIVGRKLLRIARAIRTAESPAAELHETRPI